MAAERRCTVKDKVCKDCGRLLPLERFYRRARNRDGYEARCKDCHALRYWYRTDARHEQVKALWREAQQRKYAARPDVHRERRRRYYATHRDTVLVANKRRKLQRVLGRKAKGG